MKIKLQPKKIFINPVSREISLVFVDETFSKNSHLAEKVCHVNIEIVFETWIRHFQLQLERNIERHIVSEYIRL